MCALAHRRYYLCCIWKSSAARLSRSCVRAICLSDAGKRSDSVHSLVNCTVVGEGILSSPVFGICVTAPAGRKPTGGNVTMKKLAILMVLAIAPMASAAWVDNFDSYADQAALDAVYTQMYPAVPMMLDTTLSNSPSNSIHPGAANVNYTVRMYKNFGEELAGSDAAPLEVKFMTYMTDATDWWCREYIEMRGYSGSGYNDGDLQELIAQGATSSEVDTSKYYVRTLTGDGKENADVARIADEWVELKALIKTSTVEYYVNGVLAADSPRDPSYTFDCVVIGSGLSSRVDVNFDDLSIQVIPEPASLALLALGGFALIRRR